MSQKGTFNSFRAIPSGQARPADSLTPEPVAVGTRCLQRVLGSGEHLAGRG